MRPLAYGHQLIAKLPVLATAGGNWFHQLFRQAGASAHSASLLVTFLVAPAEVVVTLVVAFFAARYGARGVRRLFSRYLDSHGGVDEDAGMRLSSLGALSANLWRFLISICAIAIILSLIGINLTPLLASATVIGATLGFGAQTLVRDYLSGFLLAIEDQFAIGETIEVGAAVGVVEEISLRVTRVRTDDGAIIFIPNGEIRVMMNRSRDWALARCEVPIRPLGSKEIKVVIAALREKIEKIAEETGEDATSLTITPSVRTDPRGSTLRITLKTTPSKRVRLEHRLRQRAVTTLVEENAWPSDSV